MGEFAEKMAEDVGATADDASGILEFSLKHWIDLGEWILKNNLCALIDVPEHGSLSAHSIVRKLKAYFGWQREYRPIKLDLSLCYLKTIYIDLF